MRRQKQYLLRILLAAALVLMMAASCFAADKTVQGECWYEGGKTIESNFDTAGFYHDTIQNLQPGDDVEFTITFTNRSGKDTDWYMENKVLESLEDNKDRAQNGGYTYILKNTVNGQETVLFDNSAVGGESKAGGLEGLHQATNATKDMFFIGTLAPGEHGTTTLYVKFDGESESNSYMNTKGALQVAYAVEVNEDGSTTTARTVAKTGDPGNMTIALLTLAASLLLMLAALISWRKSRKGGEKA